MCNCCALQSWLVHRRHQFTVHSQPPWTYAEHLHLAARPWVHGVVSCQVIGRFASHRPLQFNPFHTDPGSSPTVVMNWYRNEVAGQQGHHADVEAVVKCSAWTAEWSAAGFGGTHGSCRAGSCPDADAIVALILFPHSAFCIDSRSMARCIFIYCLMVFRATYHQQDDCTAC